MIRPSGVHTAPSGWATSTTVLGVPPDRGTFFSFPPAKNPSQAPSGEKNGEAASSVPITATGSSLSSGLT